LWRGGNGGRIKERKERNLSLSEEKGGRKGEGRGGGGGEEGHHPSFRREVGRVPEGRERKEKEGGKEGGEAAWRNFPLSLKGEESGGEGEGGEGEKDGTTFLRTKERGRLLKGKRGKEKGGG